jgi:hypothetical protein
MITDDDNIENNGESTKRDTGSPRGGDSTSPSFERR